MILSGKDKEIKDRQIRDFLRFPYNTQYPGRRGFSISNYNVSFRQNNVQAPWGTAYYTLPLALKRKRCLQINSKKIHGCEINYFKVKPQQKTKIN